MSEAILLAIITPAAMTLSAIILKVWENIVKRKERAFQASQSEKNEWKEDRDKIKKEYDDVVEKSRGRTERLEEELRQAKMDYFELYQQFYLLRLAHAQETQDSEKMNATIYGAAPHEKREQLARLDKGE